MAVVTGALSLTTARTIVLSQPSGHMLLTLQEASDAISEWQTVTLFRALIIITLITLCVNCINISKEIFNKFGVGQLTRYCKHKDMLCSRAKLKTVLSVAK